jgi:hypothetical protein
VKGPFWARAVSTVFHPFMMPLLTLLSLYLADEVLRQQPVMFFYLGFILLINTLGAAISLFVMFRKGAIGDLEITERTQRTRPFLVVLVYYAMTWAVLESGDAVHTPAIYLAMLRGLVCSIATSILITRWFKLSMHTLAAGGLVGALWATGQIHFSLNLPVILFWIGVAGLVGTARLALGVHRPSEVYWGFIWGWVVMGGTMLFYA